MAARMSIRALALVLLATVPAGAQEGVDEILRELEAMGGAGATSIDQATVDALVAAELPRVEAASGMRAKSPIKTRLVTREEAQAHVLELIDEQLPPERRLPMEHAWRAMGFLEPGASLRDAVATLYAGQAGGFYDMKTKELVLLSDLPAMLQAPVVRHELVHALQDQTYDLEKWLGDAGEDEDRAAAVQAVLEGHATDVMNRATLAGLGLEELMEDPDMAAALEGLFEEPGDGGASLLDPSASASLMAGMLPAGTPRPLVAQLLFPYLTGATFVSGYLAAHPSDPSASALYERPPQTTAEVLEPELWKSGMFVPAYGTHPGTSMPDFALTYSSTNGRLLTWVLLTDQVEPAAGEPGAARWNESDRDKNVAPGSGWRGDRVAVYRRSSDESGAYVPGSAAVVWASAWRDEAEAISVAELLAAREPVAIEVRKARVHVVFDAGGASPEAWLKVLRGWR